MSLLFILKIVALLIASYVVGSITTGDIVARIKKVNLRGSGSGNVGATNVFRTMGPASGVIVLVGDALKGIIAVLLGNLIRVSGFDLSIATGIMAIIGHNWPVFSGFKGGKGMAVSLGVAIALAPMILIVLIPVWAIVFVCFGYVSLASIIAAVFYPLVVYLFYAQDIYLLIFSICGAVIVIFRHKSNIARLFKGEEHRILYQKKKGSNS